jgi:carboxypeptidase PM20D1
MRAVTRLTGSAGDNVIAERATALVNARIAIGSSVQQTVDEMRRAIADDEVAIDVLYAAEPSPVSPSDGPVWDLLTEVIDAHFPGVTVAPYVMLQASDAKHFTRISDTVYRFLPFDIPAAERATIHAIDESIRVETLERGVRFFEALIARL